MMCGFGLRHSNTLVPNILVVHSRQGTDGGRASALVEGAWHPRQAPPSADFSFDMMNAGPMAADLEPGRMGHHAMERRL